MAKLLTEEEIEALREKYKRIAHVVGKGGAYECVFRKPTRVEYSRFRAMAHDPMKVAGSTELFARTCCVYPSREAFEELLEDYPAIPEVAGPKLAELANGGGEEDAKT